jgi:hypothetical protein
MIKQAALAIYNPVMRPVYAVLERIGFIRRDKFLAQFKYASDGLYTVRNADFMTEPEFVRATRIAKEATQHPFHHTWRAHVSIWAASHALQLDGDFVECGVWKGLNARVLFEYLDLDAKGRKFYLIDTYKGLDPRYISDAERKHGLSEDHYGDFYDAAAENLSRFKNAVIVRGAVPDILSSVTPERVAYLHIDMNNAVPEIAAAEYFWPRMVAGSIMLLDDYGFGTHIEQKRAFDKFAAEKGVAILSLPTGQGLIIR